MERCHPCVIALTTKGYAIDLSGGCETVDRLPDAARQVPTSTQDGGVHIGVEARATV
jgi:hypothetical protein